MACEACWAQAYTRSQILGGSQSDHYRDLLAINEGKSGHIDDDTAAARALQDIERGEDQ